MKIRLERSGTSFEFERPPMSKHRFRALCLLAAGGIYARMAIGIAKLCGICGLLVLVAATFIFMLAAKDFF